MDDHYDPPPADELSAADVRNIRNEAVAKWSAIMLVQLLTVAAAECQPELQEALASVFDLRLTIDEHNRVGAMLSEVIGRQQELEATMRKIESWFGKVRSWAVDVAPKIRQAELMVAKMEALEKRLSQLNGVVPYQLRNGPLLAQPPKEQKR